MSRYIREMQQRAWERDISSYQRAVDLAAIITSPRVRDILNAHAEEIRARYPQFIKASISSPPSGGKAQS